MSLNWTEIDRILAELPWEGSQLQSVRQSDYHHYFLDFYTPGRAFTVVVGLSPRQTRLHEVRQRPPTLKRSPRFTEFLRARLVGAHVVAARQLGHERIVELRFLHAEEPLVLWIRLWGGAANLLLTDGRHILDAAFRRPASGEVIGGLFDPEAQLASAPARAEKVFTARDFADELAGEPGASYNRLVELHYRSLPAVQVEQLREQALRLVERRQVALAQAREKSLAKAKDFARRDDFKLYGDVLTADLWRIAKGSGTFEGTDWRDGSAFRLELDPRLAPHEHAQVWYKKYQKARDGQHLVDAEFASQAEEEARWAHWLEVLPTLDAEPLQAFLDKHRVVRGEQTIKKGEDRPGLEFVSGPWTIWVGRNARENDTLLRRWVRGNDLWLHTRDVPGGYVFIRFLKGKSFPLEVLLDASSLAVWYSRAKGEGRADLYYTSVKYLRRAKGGPLGLVLPTQEKNLTVVVDPVRMERLMRTGDGNSSKESA